MTCFTRLIFATSVLLSTSAQALESLDDDMLAETLGQAGITVSVTPQAGGISFSTVIHDSNGFTGFTTPGALVIGRPLSAVDDPLNHIASRINTNGVPITILLDAAADVDGTTAGSQGAALGINITIPSGTVINTGTVSVAQSNGAAAISNQSKVILNNLTITLPGNMVLNMTLGNEATGGQMMRLGSTMTGGLLLGSATDISKQVAIRDATATGPSGNAIRAATIRLDNAGASTDLNLDIKVDVIPTGLQATLATFGTSGVDIRMTDLRLGDTSSTSMGNLNILGLNATGAVLKLYGH